jgi:hypothetical protein
LDEFLVSPIHIIPPAQLSLFAEITPRASDESSQLLWNSLSGFLFILLLRHLELDNGHCVLIPLKLKHSRILENKSDAEA